MSILLIAALGLSAATPALAQNEAAGAPAPREQRAANPDERRICVRERVSESRMTRRVCRTAREWREAADTE